MKLMEKSDSLKPLTYYIADEEKQKNSIIIYGELSENEYKSLIEMLSILNAFRDCYSIKEMLLESENDITSYFSTISTRFIPPDDSEISPYLITANKLLMNYLSFLKTFFDVVSNKISKMCNKKLPVFQKYNSKLYDDLFGYRFLTRLRNYAVHREMPLKHIEVSSQNGTQITCHKSALLEYDKWSTVKNEICALTDSIDVLPYIEDSKKAILKLYVKALEILECDVYSLKIYFERLCSGLKFERAVIINTKENIHELRVESLPTYYLDLFFSELKRYSAYKGNDSQ